MSAQIFKACDRVILKLMLALSTSGHGRKAHQQRHDFSEPKNPLTSVTKILHMNPRAVHTTMHVRPSVCDVLFNVCLPGQSTMLRSRSTSRYYIRSSNPMKVLTQGHHHCYHILKLNEPVRLTVGK